MKKIFFALVVALVGLGAAAGDTKWYAGENMPLLGKGIDPATTVNRYQRLPDSMKTVVRRDAVYYLGTNSAGMALRFASNSPYIKVKWKSVHKNLMNHMTPTGTRGLDLYAMLPDSSWTFVNSARPNMDSHYTETTIINNMDPEWREYMLYLSLYDGTDSVYVGIDSDYELTDPTVNLPRVDKPVVFYGTSILQGGCANRAGNCHTNILRRRLNRDMINFGFSGNGQLDLEIAEVLAAVPDPAMYVLDFVPNCSDEQIDTLMVPFVEILEKAHPGIPMLFVEDPNFPHKRFDKHIRNEVDRRNGLMRNQYEKLAARYPNFYYLPADDIMGHDGEATVDGLHFTDMGFTRFANLLEPILNEILEKHP